MKPSDGHTRHERPTPVGSHPTGAARAHLERLDEMAAKRDDAVARAERAEADLADARTTVRTLTGMVTEPPDRESVLDAVERWMPPGVVTPRQRAVDVVDDLVERGWLHVAGDSKARVESSSESAVTTVNADAAVLLELDDKQRRYLRYAANGVRGYVWQSATWSELRTLGLITIEAGDRPVPTEAGRRWLAAHDGRSG